MSSVALPIPYLGDDIVALIGGGLGVRELGRLACAAQRFWRPSVPAPKGPELWSVAEEGARRRLLAQSEQVRGWVSRDDWGGSWLRALAEAERLQRPLRFTAHDGIQLHEEGTVVSSNLIVMDHFLVSAVCGGHEMRRGRHYATFTLRSLTDFTAATLGVVEAGFDPSNLDEEDNAAFARQGWVLHLWFGQLCREGHPGCVTWEGQPAHREIKQGDVVVRVLPPPPIRPPDTAPCAGHAARPRRGHADGVAERRAEGRHGPPRHDRPVRQAGGGAAGAAALGGRHRRRPPGH